MDYCERVIVGSTGSAPISVSRLVMTGSMTKFIHRPIARSIRRICDAVIGGQSDLYMMLRPDSITTVQQQKLLPDE